MSAVLRVRDDKGNIINIPAIKGDKGDDGFSTTAEVTDTGTGREVAITDKNGVHRFSAGFTILTATAQIRGTSATQADNYTITFPYSDYTGSAEVLPTLLVLTTSPPDSFRYGSMGHVAICCKALTLGKTHNIVGCADFSVSLTLDGQGGMNIVTKYSDTSTTFPVTATLMI